MTFWKMVAPSSSGWRSPERQAVLLGLLDPKDQYTVVLWMVRNCSPNDTSHHSNITESLKSHPIL